MTADVTKTGAIEAEPPGKRPQREGKRTNVLITGVTSTVGRHLSHRLYHDTRVGTIWGVAFEPKPDAFATYNPERFVYRRTNILKSRELKDLFRSQDFRRAGITAVVHLAFINRPKAAGSWAHRLNVDGTKRLLDECIACDTIGKFVFKSSDVVYKLTPDGPVYLDENADLNFDVDADSWVKDRVDADMICRAKMDDPGLRVIVLRITPIIGGSPNRRYNSYFGSPLQFRAMGFNPLINVVHVSDVIQALEQSVFRDTKGVFNIAGGDTAPVSALGEAAGSRIVPIPTPLLFPANWLARKMGASYYYPVDHDRMRYAGLLDIAKARRVLGYEPHRFLSKTPGERLTD